ncbi:MAG: hypothetical protein CEE40_10555 [Chloroflexi bacterium B3_Chlor]|nr:MAG: hypothetical protein CEE40_10555 [Chloroflexi bacterium B3_Chlor]
MHRRLRTAGRFNHDLAPHDPAADIHPATLSGGPLRTYLPLARLANWLLAQPVPEWAQLGEVPQQASALAIA